MQGFTSQPLSNTQSFHSNILSLIIVARQQPLFLTHIFEVCVMVPGLWRRFLVLFSSLLCPVCRSCLYVLLSIFCVSYLCLLVSSIRSLVLSLSPWLLFPFMSLWVSLTPCIYQCVSCASCFILTVSRPVCILFSFASPSRHLDYVRLCSHLLPLLSFSLVSIWCLHLALFLVVFSFVSLAVCSTC